MLTRIICALSLVLVAVGCAGDASSTSNEPVITGDRCALYSDQGTCDGDASCYWQAAGCACPANMGGTCPACPPSQCVSKGETGSGSGSGGGSGSANSACACPNGEVCFEQVGGPAQQGGTPPDIQCTLPAPGTGDACARIQDEGSCSESDTVSGLCLCDNGAR